MLSKKVLIISSSVLSTLFLLFVQRKNECGTDLINCLDCYCGQTVKGWPLIWLNLEGGALKLYKINYLYLLLDFSLYFFLILIFFTLISKLFSLFHK